MPVLYCNLHISTVRPIASHALIPHTEYAGQVDKLTNAWMLVTGVYTRVMRRSCAPARHAKTHDHSLPARAKTHLKRLGT